MSIRTFKFPSTIAYTIAAGGSILTLFFVFVSVKWCLANAASLAADRKEIAEYAVSISPSDPQPHFAAAVLLEKTFLPADYERSLLEYETATALSPSNFLIWIEYGRSLDRHGEEERAEIALRKALELAPHYASAKWALGNFLLRHGDTDEGFSMLRDAVNSNSALADPTVQSAYAWFDRNIEEVRRSLGDSPAIQTSLVKLLVREKRADEAFNVWQASSVKRDDPSNEAASQLLSLLVSEKKFRQAYEVFTVGRGPSNGAAVTNGSFEDVIKTQNASVFDWQIVDSPKVQVAIVEGQMHGGTRSLRLLYDVTEDKDFSGVSQYVAVEPEKRYFFEAYYRADLKTSVPLRWEIADAHSGEIIVATDALKNTADWARVSAEFTPPAKCEAVILRLAREKCPSTICPISGSIFLDEVSIRLR